MASVNKVILVGNIGKDPEIRYMADGSAVVNLSLATTSSWKDKATGEKKTDTEWHRIVAYGRLAEIIGEYVKKGSSIYIEGRLKTRKWQDQSGVDKYTTEIIADQMQMLGGKASEQDDKPTPSAPQQQRRAPASQPRSVEDMDDDIPY